MPEVQHNRRQQLVWALFWAGIYFLALLGVEAIIIFDDYEIGLALNSLLIGFLLIHASRLRSVPIHYLLTTLTLVPLLRLVSLAIPLGEVTPRDRFLFTGLPMISAAMTAAGRLGLSRRQIGLYGRRWWAQPLVMLLGFPFALAAYALLGPVPLVREIDGWRDLLVPVLIVVLAGALMEELVFRGLILRAAVMAIGPQGIVFAAAVSVVPTLAFENRDYSLFVFGVGLSLGLAVEWTQNLWGAIGAHGIMNVLVFIIFPYLTAQS